MYLKTDLINIGYIKMLYMIGMLISWEPEAEVIFLVELHDVISTVVLYLRCGSRSLWLEPITSAMLHYAMQYGHG